MARPTDAQYRADLRHLRRELERLDARLGDPETDDLTIAVTLRDIIASDSRRQLPGINIDEPHPDTWYWPMRTWDAMTNVLFGGNRCGGLTFMYLHALSAFGLKARYVGMYTNYSYENGVVESHATADVFIDGAWIGMDPTYNCSLRDNNNARISWSAARTRLQAGSPFSFDSDGVGVRPDFLPLSQSPGWVAMTKYMILGPSEGVSEVTLIGGWAGLVAITPGAPAHPAAYSLVGHDDQRPVDITTLYEMIANNRLTDSAELVGAWAQTY